MHTQTWLRPTKRVNPYGGSQTRVQDEQVVLQNMGIHFLLTYPSVRMLVCVRTEVYKWVGDD